MLCGLGAGGIILQNNTITGSAASAPFGAGIWLQEGAGGVAGNVIKNNQITAGKFVGLGLTGDTHGIILQGNTVSGTTLGSTFVGVSEVMIGDGLNVFAGASATITGNTLHQNGRAGLILDAGGGERHLDPAATPKPRPTAPTAWSSRTRPLRRPRSAPTTARG